MTDGVQENSLPRVDSRQAVTAGHRVETVLAFVLGATLLGVLAYAGLREEPIASARQFFLLRVISAVSVAGVTALIPGILRIRFRSRRAGLGLRAGGAFAAFVLVYMWNPPKVAEEARNAWTEPSDPPAIAATEPPAEPRPEVQITSLATVSNARSAATRSEFYCRFFEYSGTGDYAAKFNGALEAIKEAVKESGAMAFVNARVSGQSYEVQGSKWHSSIVHICGDLLFAH